MQSALVAYCAFILSFLFSPPHQEKQRVAQAGFSLVGVLLWWNGDPSTLEKHSEPPLQAACPLPFQFRGIALFVRILSLTSSSQY